MKYHFESLGLKEDASQQAIQEAYDRLSKELNPSNNDNQEFFVEEYQKVQEAYKALNQSSILATKEGARNKSTYAKKITKLKKEDIANPSEKSNAQTGFLSLKKEIVGIISIIVLLCFSIYFIFKDSQSKYPDLDDGVYAEFNTSKGVFVAIL